jgi:glycerol-3-phosphate dehydrogenase
VYDVVIIGAGVSGCAVARELSKYELNICVLEKETDICEGTSKANSGIVNAGFDPAPGTLCAKLNAPGAEMIAQIAKELDVPYKRNGTMVVCNEEENLSKLQILYKQGEINGVKGLHILNGEEAHNLEPNLANGVCGALLVESGGIVCPFTLTLAFAEVAYANDVEFRLGEEVTNIAKKESGYSLTTSKGYLETRYVINAAGVYADIFHNMVSEDKLTIVPRKGEYCLMDKIPEDYLRHTIFPVPTKMGKGVIVSPTVHGNMLIGPTAVDVHDRDDTSTSLEGLHKVIKMSALSVKDIPYQSIITSFAGLRAQERGNDFIIEEVSDAKGFIDVAGIKSPGLASSPMIALYVRDILAGICDLKEKKEYVTKRKGLLRFNDLTIEKQKVLVREKPEYGRVICRCEKVTEGEIIEAIRRPLGARTVDGIKRRTRAGMGRCQAGFCTPRVMEILSRELGKEMEDICKNRSGSQMVQGRNKDSIQEEN